MNLTKARTVLMPRKPKRKEATAAKAYIARSITLPAEIDSRLNTLAERENWSLSFIVTEALKVYLESAEKRTK